MHEWCLRHIDKPHSSLLFNQSLSDTINHRAKSALCTAHSIPNDLLVFGSATKTYLFGKYMDIFVQVRK
jgi:hypothetical protein